MAYKKFVYFRRGGRVGSGDVVGRTGVRADRQTFLSAIATENHAKLQKLQRKGSTELLRTNIIAMLGGLMHKDA